jgi:hypothetical protein
MRVSAKPRLLGNFRTGLFWDDKENIILTPHCICKPKKIKEYYEIYIAEQISTKIHYFQ